MNNNLPENFTQTVLVRCLLCNYTFIWNGEKITRCKSCGAGDTHKAYSR